MYQSDRLQFCRYIEAALRARKWLWTQRNSLIWAIENQIRLINAAAALALLSLRLGCTTRKVLNDFATFLVCFCSCKARFFASRSTFLLILNFTSPYLSALFLRNSFRANSVATMLSSLFRLIFILVRPQALFTLILNLCKRETLCWCAFIQWFIFLLIRLCNFRDSRAVSCLHEDWINSFVLLQKNVLFL